MNAGERIDGLLMLIILLSFLSFHFSANADLPDYSFACQIQQIERGITLKLVQAKSIDEAVEVARLGEKGKEKIYEVIQCIEIGKENFRDRIFQKNFENMPR